MYSLIETEHHIDQTLNLIEEIWKENPDMSLCEIISASFPKGTDLYFQRDPDLIDAICQKFK